MEYLGTVAPCRTTNYTILYKASTYDMTMLHSMPKVLKRPNGYHPYFKGSFTTLTHLDVKSNPMTRVHVSSNQVTIQPVFTVPVGRRWPMACGYNHSIMDSLAIHFVKSCKLEVETKESTVIKLTKEEVLLHGEKSVLKKSVLQFTPEEYNCLKFTLPVLDNFLHYRTLTHQSVGRE